MAPPPKGASVLAGEAVDVDGGSVTGCIHAAERGREDVPTPVAVGIRTDGEMINGPRGDRGRGHLHRAAPADAAIGPVSHLDATPRAQIRAVEIARLVDQRREDHLHTAV